MYKLEAAPDKPWRVFITLNGRDITPAIHLPVLHSHDKTFGDAMKQPENAVFLQNLQDMLNHANADVLAPGK